MCHGQCMGQMSRVRYGKPSTRVPSATPAPVAPAEASGIDPDSVDLILVAQALHWFDMDRFFAEAKRVSKESGILAVSTYTLVSVNPQIDAILSKFYHETTGPYWPPERDLVETNFENVRFPFSELPSREFRCARNGISLS